MLRQICSAVALLVTPTLATCQSSLAESETGWLSGRIIDVQGAPLESHIEIDGVSFATDSQGNFSISPPKSAVYRLEIEAEGHYPMRQTFSHSELADQPTLADIRLVARKPGRTLFVFGGDVMIGRRFKAPFEGEPVLVSPDSTLEDSKVLLAEMKPYLERADYASINLESPIFETPPSAAAPKSVTFFSSPETLEALEWAGLDYVALGNNHIYDFLEPGLEITLHHLDKSRLDFSGAGQNEREALRAHRLVRGADQFDFLSYVGWAAGPPTQSADADKGGAALGTAENLSATTRASRARAGIPILQFHGGLEYVEEPTLAIETRLKQAVDKGAALIIGHHPHVVQGLELYNGQLIAWSLGNFLFDQYFYSAQSAALLYVWMDGDQFYHAEAVPLYIKGYHPTPAVGPMRNAINRRLFDLSARRATQLVRSGGHMALLSQDPDEALTPKFTSQLECVSGTARSGLDLLARGDFAAHDLFGAPDRSWLDLDPRIDIRAEQPGSSDHIMHINLTSGAAIMTGMRKFQRVFTPGTPMSVRAALSSTSDVEIDVYLQIRATGQTLEEALQNGRRTLIGSQKVRAGAPTKLDIDFDSPRTRARSIRILIEARSGADAGIIELDNLQLVEWKTPFTSPKSECASPTLSE